MKEIDLAARTDLVWGIDRVEKVGGACAFRRMPPELEQFYSDTPQRRARALCTSGVRLKMRTDARRMRIDAVCRKGARKLYQLDLDIDGERASSPGPVQCSAEGWRAMLFDRPDRPDRAERKVELWLTQCSETRLRAFEVDSRAEVEPVERPGAWLALGDSITQGMTTRTPADCCANLLAARLGVELRNVAVGGATMQPELGRLCRAIQADFATVAFGVNDWARPVGLAAFAENARRVLGDLVQGRENLPVAVVTPLPVLGRDERNGFGETLEDYRAVLRRVAADFGAARVVEGTGCVPAEADCFVDGVHPNEKGMAAYADGLEGALRAMAGRAAP